MGLGDLRKGEAAEEAQGNDPGAFGVLRFQPDEGLVNHQDAVVGGGGGEVQVVDVQPLCPLAALEAGLGAGVIDEDAAHGQGRGAEEMHAVVPTRVFLVHQSQPRFMHERGGLQGLPRGFAGHAGGREVAQLVVNEGEQLFGGPTLAALNGGQQEGDFTHERGGA